MPSIVVTVTQLNAYIKSLLEGDNRLNFISIRGEISNFKRHFASGHIYFTLKDDSSTLKCVMFKGNAERLKFEPKEGMQVICTGRISVYERDGVYQMYAENMKPDGEGDLLLKLEQLKERLTKEGMFDASVKRGIPKFPKKVGVITSETGAAVKDIFNVLGRRYPMCDIVFCPATVQGELAPSSLCTALDKMEQTDADVVIIGRGGGSIEDLWCFNDEKLVRRIFTFSKPIISAVGHETDFTLSDFVCDLRAPTPSAAAELAVPDCEELKSNILSAESFIEKKIINLLASKQNALDLLLKNRIFTSPEEYIFEKRILGLDFMTDKLENGLQKLLTVKENKCGTQIARLDALSPAKTLLRGFAVVESDGINISSVKSLSENEKITVRFHDGKADCTVDKIM